MAEEDTNAERSANRLSGTGPRSMQKLRLGGVGQATTSDPLRRHSRSSTYLSLVEEPMQALDDPERRLNAVKVLSGAAHPKCLGDIYLEEMPGFEWPNLVSSLGEVAGRYIWEHDANAPVGRELGFSQAELIFLTKSLLPTYVHSPPMF